MTLHNKDRHNFQEVDKLDEPLYDSSLFLDEASMKKVKEFTRERKSSTEMKGGREVTKERDQRIWK